MKIKLKCGVRTCECDVFVFTVVYPSPNDYRSVSYYPLCKKHSKKFEKKMSENMVGDDSDLVLVTKTLDKMSSVKFDLNQFSYLMCNAMPDEVEKSQ